jgi:hypothetical protein
MKLAIIGGPFSGKSTLAQSYGVKVFCTDPVSLVREKIDGVTYLPEGLEWEAQSHYICEHWLSMPGDWVIEGVGVVRALRKWINYYDSVPPCYQLIYIKGHHPKATGLTSGHVAMSKSIESIWNEISPVYEKITTVRSWWSEDVVQAENKQSNTFKMFKL